MMDRSFMRESVRGFEMYYNPVIAPGTLRMDTNTNVLGSNPAAIAALRSLDIQLNGYPNTYSDGLRRALAERYGLDMGNFTVGNGSDEMLNTAYTAFAEPGRTVCTVPCPSYSLYSYFVGLASAPMREVMLDGDFELDVDAMVGKGEENDGIIIMPSPNNPTGNCFRQKDVEEILAKHRGLVILDEAYSEYARRTMVPRVEEFDNLVVMKTFSKAYAMANLRVGYAVSNRRVSDMLNAVKVPYSLNTVSETAAIAAVGDSEFVERSVSIVESQRPVLASRLRTLGFEPFPSDSNFILARSPIDHAELVEGLKKRKVLIRDFGSKKRTENCVRMTVGTPELNDVMLSAIEDVLSEARR